MSQIGEKLRMSPGNLMANPNHPKSGDTIKGQPVRTLNAINKIKKTLAGDRLELKQRKTKNGLMSEHPKTHKVWRPDFCGCANPG